MKIILQYSWCDPWVAQGTETIPFEYSSKEDAFVDFFSLHEVALKEDYKTEFFFAGRNWYIYEDLANSIQFFDLEEWFERNKVK